MSTKPELTMQRTATCCCGQTSIQVEGDPHIHLVCHCDNCKTRTGSAFGISAYFSDSQIISKHGPTQVYRIDTPETEQERHFCPTCGTTLYWKVYRYPTTVDIASMTGVAGGCFVDKPLPPPTATANHDGKCSWLEVPGLNIIEPARR